MRLTTDGLGHRFPDGPWLFRHLSVEFPEGSVTALVGPSGTGKSTLLRILSGDLPPAEGAVQRDGIERIATIAQTAHGVIQRSGLDQLVLPLLARGRRREQAEAEAMPIAELFGLGARIHAPYRELSGGEAQRLMLARAMAQGADLILADEPTASLDAANAAGVIRVLANLSDAGATVVVATHDPRARDACHSVIDLADLADLVLAEAVP